MKRCHFTVLRIPMPFSAFPEDVIGIVAEECAIQQREDERFYPSSIRRQPKQNVVWSWNYGVEELSMTSSIMRRICLPVLFRKIMIKPAQEDGWSVEKSLQYMLRVLTSNDRGDIAPLIQ
jgi:hypothetical protein